jgi:hypothetical protein
VREAITEYASRHSTRSKDEAFRKAYETIADDQMLNWAEESARHAPGSRTDGRGLRGAALLARMRLDADSRSAADEVAEQGHTLAGQDALGMELDAFDRQLAVTQTHDQPVGCAGRDL